MFQDERFSTLPSMAPDRKVLMIGLDAGDRLLVDRWIADGTLENLGALKRSGTSGRLETSAKYLAGSPWPTFYTGLPPSHHGLYADFQWRPDTMEYARPDAGWFSARPFWRSLGDGRRVIAYDVPMILSSEAFDGVEISGWASHDKYGPPESHPPELLDEVKRKFGEWPVSQEPYGPSRVGDLLALREELIENTHRSCRLASWLLDRPWDLAIVAFSAPHRGGHRLWSRSSIRGGISEKEGAVFDGALHDIYAACDRAIGELVNGAPGATVVVFSVHGMGPNTSRTDLFDDMLEAVLHGRESDRPRPGLFRRAGEMLPLEARRFLTARIPRRLQNRLMSMWTTGGVQWDETRAFPLRADLQGYVRINLQGREAVGTVPPGEPSERLCERITEGLLTFSDSTTGERIVESVQPVDRLFPDGPRVDRLPDLIVQWKDTPADRHEAVESPRFGTVSRKTPGRIPNGRSGNHRPEGIIIASGAGIAPGIEMERTADILDLPPTVLALMGVEVPIPLAGQPIAEIVGP